MTLFVRILGLVFALFTISGAAAAESVVHHQLQVTLTPQDGRIKVRDIITLPPHGATLHFSLHRGWSPSSPATDVRIEPDPQTQTPTSPEIEEYRLSLPADSATLTMDYQGRIVTLPQDGAAGIMGDQHATGGIIGPDGVYLDGNSSWYPV